MGLDRNFLPMTEAAASGCVQVSESAHRDLYVKTFHNQPKIDISFGMFKHPARERFNK